MNQLNDSSTQQSGRGSRRGHLTRVLVLYAGISFAVLESADIFTDQLGLPHWFFVGTIILLAVGLPIVLTTALVHVVSQRRRETVAEAAGPGPAADEAPTAAEGPAAVQPPARYWLTWRRAIVGGVVVLALWGLFVAGYMMLRATGIGPVGSLVAAGVIDEREPVILADFENFTADSLLGRATTEAFQTDLSQSTIVTLVSANRVDRALRRMRMNPDQPLDEELARQVAIREGIKAVVAGDITPVGSGYSLTARLVSPEDGAVLAAARETAGDSTEMIRAIDQLSKRLRERIGESLKTIRQSEPLDQVTTPSLAALRKYSQAVRVTELGEYERAISLLEEAVAIDTGFAMAWRKLGVNLGNTGGDRAREIEALTQAFKHRHRLADRERYMTEGSYYQGATRESDRAAAAYQSLLDLYPNDAWAMNNLAIIYLQTRDYRRAAELYERAIDVDSAGSLYYGNAIAALVAAGEFQRAEVTYALFSEKFPEHPSALLDGAALASARFDYDLAEERIRAARETPSSNRLVQLGLIFSEAQIAEIRGQLGEAERLLEETRRVFEQQGDQSRALASAMRIAFYDLLLRGQPDRAVERIETALVRHPLEEMDPLDRPYQSLAVFYAIAGRDEQARAMLDAYEGMDDPRAARDYDGEDEIARAVLALNQGRTEEAIRQARQADVGECVVCTLPALGHIYDATGQADSVIAVYERYLDTPWLYRLASSDWWSLAAIYERLGGLYELEGDVEKSMMYYHRFVELWENADPDLQPRVQAAKRALERLAAEV